MTLGPNIIKHDYLYLWEHSDKCDELFVILQSLRNDQCFGSRFCFVKINNIDLTVTCDGIHLIICKKLWYMYVAWWNKNHNHFYPNTPINQSLSQETYTKIVRYNTFYEKDELNFKEWYIKGVNYLCETFLWGSLY